MREIPGVVSWDGERCGEEGYLLVVRSSGRTLCNPRQLFFLTVRLTLGGEELLQPVDTSQHFLVVVGSSVFSTRPGSVGGGQYEGESSHEALIPNMGLG